MNGEQWHVVYKMDGQQSCSYAVKFFACMRCARHQSKSQRFSNLQGCSTCPNAVHHYNQFIGGVDVKDQRKVTHQFSHRSSHKYYLRLVFDIVDIGVNNAAIVQEKLCNDTNFVAMDTKAFRCCVA